MNLVSLGPLKLSQLEQGSGCCLMRTSNSTSPGLMLQPVSVGLGTFTCSEACQRTTSSWTPLKGLTVNWVFGQS